MGVRNESDRPKDGGEGWAKNPLLNWEEVADLSGWQICVDEKGRKPWFARIGTLTQVQHQVTVQLSPVSRWGSRPTVVDGRGPHCSIACSYEAADCVRTPEGGYTWKEYGATFTLIPPSAAAPAS